MSAAQLKFMDRDNSFCGPVRLKLLPISSLTQGPRQASLLSCPVSRKASTGARAFTPSFLIICPEALCAWAKKLKVSLQKRSSHMKEKHNPVRHKIKILFIFAIHKLKQTLFRAVSAIDRSFRVDRHSEHTRKFKPAMWCGSEGGLLNFRVAVETYNQNLPRSKK